MKFSTARRRKAAATASILALSAGIAIADQAAAQTLAGALAGPSWPLLTGRTV